MRSKAICRITQPLFVTRIPSISMTPMPERSVSVSSDCCLQGVCQNGADFDCSMRGLTCCLETGEGSPRSCEDLNAYVLASIFDVDYRDRIYSWAGTSGTQYACIVFRFGDEETMARFPDLAVIGVARQGEHRQPVCLRHSRDFNTQDNHQLREAAKKLGCTEWHVHFAGNFETFCHDFARYSAALTPELQPVSA